MNPIVLSHTTDPATSEEGDERWRPVLGYEGLYEVSDRGNVRSLTRRLSNGRLWRGRPVALIRRAKSGHMFVNLNMPRKFRAVHALVLEAFVGPRPAGMHGLHWNDVPNDNRLENLRWGTPSENKYDEVRNGLHFNANRTHCTHGHPLAEPNLMRSKRERRRRCLACQRARSCTNRRGLPFDPVLADLKYAEIVDPSARVSTADYFKQALA